jgi:hypothetical protein
MVSSTLEDTMTIASLTTHWTMVTGLFGVDGPRVIDGEDVFKETGTSPVSLFLSIIAAPHAPAKLDSDRSVSR